MSCIKLTLEDHLISLAKHYGYEPNTIEDAYLNLDGALEILEKLLECDCLFLAFPPYVNPPFERRMRMRDSFIFSAETSSEYNKDKNYNEAFIRRTCLYLQSLLKVKERLYLNDIYDQFGVSFPYKEKENILFTLDDPLIICADSAYEDNQHTIHILSNYDAEQFAESLEAVKDREEFRDIRVYY